MRPASFFVLAVLSSACWSLSSTLPDVTGGVDDAANGRDSGASDADAAVTTDAPSTESGADAGDGGGAAYCSMLSSPPFLCDDFTSGTHAPGWTKAEQGSGGSIAFADGAFIARVRQPCAGGFAQLTHTVPKKTASVRLAFSFRAAALPSNAVNHVAGFTYVTATGYYRVDLATVFDHLEIVENVTGTITSHDSGPLTFTSARRIELIADLLAKNVLVKVDGAQAIAANIQAPDPSTDETRLELGVYAGDSCPGSVDFVFDDFTYDRQDR